MGDWIRSNQFTASVIVTLLLLIIFSFTIAKPYVDKKDDRIREETLVKTDTLIDISKQNLKLLKDIADGR